MGKREFLAELRGALSGLPLADIEERVSFYSESIDDRMEEGLTEEQAVAGIGAIQDIVMQTVSEIPLTKLVKERMTPKRTLRTWELVLLILGFPVWFPLIVTAVAVAFTLYVVGWALIVTLWAVEVSLIAGAAVGLISAIFEFKRGNAYSGAAMLGASLFCGGVAVFLYFGCIAATKGILRTTKKAALNIKKRLVRKENER